MGEQDMHPHTSIAGDRVMGGLTHFVGFRGDEYSRACRVFGEPDFIHIGWDRRAFREIADGDVIVFANEFRPDQLASRNFPDIQEKQWRASPFYDPWMDEDDHRKGYQQRKHRRGRANPGDPS